MNRFRYFTFLETLYQRFLWLLWGIAERAGNPGRMGLLIATLCSPVQAENASGDPELWLSEWTAGAPIALARAYGPLGSTDAFEVQPIGTADVFGHGPYDLFLADHRLLAFSHFRVNGSPVYEAPRLYSRPARNGSVVADAPGQVTGLFATSDNLLWTEFDRSTFEFKVTTKTPLPAAGPFGAVAASRLADGRVVVFFSSTTVQGEEPEGARKHSADYRPFDGSGIWRGTPRFQGLGSAVYPPRARDPLDSTFPLFPPGRDFQFRNPGLTMVTLGPGPTRGAIGSDAHGSFHYFRLPSADSAKPEPAVLLSDERGNGFRHPGMYAVPVAIPDPDTGLSTLIVGDTGAVWFYRFTGRFNGRGGPIFEAPTRVMVKEPMMSLGALPVITAGDLDNDGRADLVAGNDNGYLLFLKNIGTAERPGFDIPVPITVEGEPFRINAGYRGIQGPSEAQWGYTCPTLTDWNGDGWLDIVFNSILGEITLLLHKPGVDGPAFEKPMVIRSDSLELHLVWRTQPAVTDWGVEGQRCLIVNDEANVLRMFWRIDDYNVSRGEVLRLTTGEPIQAHGKRFSGQFGRTKLQAVDWDGDGLIDLLAGTGRSASIPGPGGVPDDTYEGDERQASVLFLRNAGSNAAPKFEYPRPIRFRGDKIALGVHSCSPLAIDLGKGRLDLLVGMEDGVVMYYPRDELAWPVLEGR